MFENRAGFPEHSPLQKQRTLPVGYIALPEGRLTGKRHTPTAIRRRLCTNRPQLPVYPSGRPPAAMIRSAQPGSNSASGCRDKAMCVCKCARARTPL